jgi:hypothetical protein
MRNAVAASGNTLLIARGPRPVNKTTEWTGVAVRDTIPRPDSRLACTCHFERYAKTDEVCAGQCRAISRNQRIVPGVGTSVAGDLFLDVP